MLLHHYTKWLKYFITVQFGLYFNVSESLSSVFLSSGLTFWPTWDILSIHQKFKTSNFLSLIYSSHIFSWSMMNRSAKNCRTFQIHKLKKLSKHSQEEKVLHYNAFWTGTNSLEDSLKPSHIIDLWLGVISAQQQPHVTPSLFSGKYYSLISINSPDSIWIPH